MAKKKKWYQTGEFEDGYQFGDIIRTVKNAITGNEENSENKNSHNNNKTSNFDNNSDKIKENNVSIKKGITAPINPVGV